MQTSVIALFFVTTAVVMACVVVEYAVITCEQTLDTENAPQMERIQELESMLLNQTDYMFDEIEQFNLTETQPVDTGLP
ncbi:MAG: hypothetical protein CW716_03170 [Candidatus Bathyarchaeum sp.]|nr:MAG: hypothetical protein CW716_03170 [Candidatus Bathyarchaeum sp.]